MRFFFDVVTGGETVADASGTDLSGPDVAILQAAVMAVDLAHDQAPAPQAAIRVRDEEGRLVCILPVIAAS